jgi:hypothetical protein
LVTGATLSVKAAALISDTRANQTFDLAVFVSTFWRLPENHYFFLEDFATPGIGIGYAPLFGVIGCGGIWKG